MQFFLEMSTLNQGLAVWQLYISVSWCIKWTILRLREIVLCKNMFCFRKNTKAIAFEEFIYIVRKHSQGR
jgi:hypothetical protein